MNKFGTLLLILSITLSIQSFAQSPIGIWENYDPDNGSPLSRIEFYKENGKLNARIVEIFDEDFTTTCNQCEGPRKDQILKGMTVIWNLTIRNSTQFKKGRIIDPGNGKIYKCFVQLQDDNLLKVRGYMGIKALGRTQYWSRVTESDKSIARAKGWNTTNILTPENPE